MTGAWLHLHRGKAPLVISFPHAGTQIPHTVEQKLTSPWLARKDTDWWVRQLYAFAGQLDATTIATDISRTVIDVNRDPSGTSLYPGQETTGLCPLTTFDGEALYRAGHEPDAAEITQRRQDYFEPYHRALAAELARLRSQSERVVLYDAHSIRSCIPRLFSGVLPHFNIGTDNGRTCAPELTASVGSLCSNSGLATVINGRFRGGWTTRHYGNPSTGVHAIQMELACRTYLDEPEEALGPTNWPAALSATKAAAARTVLFEILRACLQFSTP